MKTQLCLLSGELMPNVIGSTGAAPQHSDVAVGLAHAIDLTAPRLKLAGGPKPS
jgi:hypothetical protein